MAQTNTDLQSEALRRPQVLQLTNLRNTKFYELIKKGEFPKPVKIGRTSLWLRKTVLEWIALKFEQRN
ncbi:AlpA family transcriptional regulator [Uliginosibacterium sp. 31-12]|uniref:helix-turn-helix transcriptional regulator n=1 Tax=Uliginosibacterium sp. 31-12 TaxID=3062781 RepID=UPI0026E1ED14|nr:AlpA family phage regulatory protein [Uliginosibacterium sp. 31-12]MDO6387916.1 AlpA family phage regulatory protein [Uliginosibacterium sp. 31-12]